MYVCVCVSVFIHGEDSVVELEPSADPEATTYINGTLITATTALHHVSNSVRGEGLRWRGDTQDGGEEVKGFVWISGSQAGGEWE